MSEKSLWTTTRTGIKGLMPSGDCVLERIENDVGRGTPDVNYCIAGKAGWIELKFLPKWPKRAATLVRVDHFTKEQKIFLHNYSMAGGRCFVWIQVDNEYFLFDGLKAAMHLGYESASDNGWRRKDFAPNALVHFKKGASDWARFVEELTR